MQEWLKTKGKMAISDPQLWHRLQAWQRGNGGQRLVRLLRTKLKILPKNQQFIADETLRFVYLATLSTGGAVPPPLLGRVLAELRSDQAAFVSLESATGSRLPSPDLTIHTFDARHEGLHRFYRAEFGHAPAGRVWYGQLERETLRRSSIAYWVVFLGMGIMGLGVALQSVVLATLGALAGFGVGAYALGLQFAGPIQVGEADIA